MPATRAGKVPAAGQRQQTPATGGQGGRRPKQADKEAGGQGSRRLKLAPTTGGQGGRRPKQAGKEAGGHGSRRSSQQALAGKEAGGQGSRRPSQQALETKQAASHGSRQPRQQALEAKQAGGQAIGSRRPRQQALAAKQAGGQDELVRLIKSQNKQLSKSLNKQLAKSQNKQMSSMEERLTAQVDEVEKRLTAQLDEFRKEVEEQQAGMEERLTAQLDEFRQEVEEQQAGMEERLTAQVDEFRQEVDKQQNGMNTQLSRVATQQGHIFKAVVRGTPDTLRGYQGTFASLPQLLSACRLPSSATAAVMEALEAQAVLHAFRGLLVDRLGGAESLAVQAAVADWQVLPPQPHTQAEWSAEAAQATQVLRALHTKSPLHGAVLLWRECCKAACKDAAAGAAQPSAVLALLNAAPQRHMWPPGMTLLMACMGSLQPGIETNMPLRLEQSLQGAVVSVEEVKMAGGEAGAAKVQLTRTIRAIGWLFAVAGQPLPRFVATVIVPAAEKRRAEQALPAPKSSMVTLPQGLGSVSVDWSVGWV